MVEKSVGGETRRVETSSRRTRRSVPNRHTGRRGVMRHRWKRVVEERRAGGVGAARSSKGERRRQAIEEGA